MMAPNYSEGSDRFEEMAKDWDEKADVVQSSRLLYETIRRNVTELREDTAKDWDALEIGAGTGNLTMLLAPHVKSIISVDTSHNMIDILNRKAKELPSTSADVRGVNVLLDDPNDPSLEGRRFNLALTHLVMHHIPDMARTVAVMRDTLKPGGKIIISDFEDNGEHARTFHPKDKHHTVERHGITRSEIHHILLNAGFVDVSVKTGFELSKFCEDHNQTVNFPFLTCIARKP